MEKRWGKKKTPCEEFCTVGEIFRLLAFWPSMFPTPPIPCRYLWHRFRAAPQADFPLSLLIPRKKKKRSPSLPLILPFFRYAQRAETCQFFQSCFLPRSFRHARPFKKPKGWNPAERAKVTACAPEAERSRNVGCLFSCFGAVMN